MSEDEFGTRLREQDGKTWDSWPAEVTVDRDISVQKVRAFVHSAKSRVPCRLPAGISIDDPVKTILRNLDLLIGDRPTNAALLLFGSNPQRVFRSASIRAGYFRNNDDFDLFPECPGTLFEQLEPALRQIQEAYPVRVTFPSGGDVLRRAETPAFPSGALREAVVNALIHRDYTCFGSEIEVKMFADSVWIANPGGLMPHVTLEELSIKPHTSERRNPLLAKICYMDHLVEQYGTGTTRIFDECRRGGFPPPEFVNTGSGFRVTLRRQVATQVDLPPEKLHARQQLAMRHVAVNGSITPAEYQRLTGVSDRTTSRELSQLVKGGLLERKGKRHDLRYSRPARVSDIP
jgi:ATP-dependent DNA helicase RecG